MKIAVVTDDGKHVNRHFGRARYYAVYEVSGSEVNRLEQREKKTGHHGTHGSEVLHQHEHHHNYRHQREHRQGGESGHGFDGHSFEKHQMMAQEISDCDVLIAGGMGTGARYHLKDAGLKVVLTNVRTIEQAVKEFAKGDLKDMSSDLTH